MEIPGLFQILVIALILFVLLGRGRAGAMRGGFGKRIKRFGIDRAGQSDLPAENAAHAVPQARARGRSPDTPAA